MVKTSVALLIVLSLWSCSGKKESITIGRPVSDSGTLIFIADDHHFFEANGIKVTQKDYDTGLAAIDGLLNNEIDLSGGGEFPLVVKALENARISIIGSYARSFNTYLVARVDKGIRHEANLRGKRVGLPQRTIPEFYLGRFLDLHGMSIRNVTLTNLTPKQAVGAIADGAVDAVVVWEPYVSQMKERLSNRIVSWSVHSGQAQYSVLVGRNDWVKQNSELVKRVLKSLMQAEEYVARHPTEAEAILKKRYQHDDAYVARVWPEYQFSLFLDQALILALEDEARWMIKNNLTKKKQVPDFMNYVYVDGLKAVKPEAVNIIR
jgi:NitT/TauT family transport system substrate-binding protein